MSLSPGPGMWAKIEKAIQKRQNNIESDYTDIIDGERYQRIAFYSFSIYVLIW